jgi:hypothetical protein
MAFMFLRESSVVPSLRDADARSFTESAFCNPELGFPAIFRRGREPRQTGKRR